MILKIKAECGRRPMVSRLMIGYRDSRWWRDYRMIRTKKHGCGWWRPAVLAACFAMALGGVFAQIPKIPGVTTKPVEAKPEEDMAKRLDDWQKQAEDALTRLEGKAVPDGILLSEVEAGVRDVEQILFGIATVRKENTALETARKARVEANDRAKAWVGFEEQPPYSVLLLDELEDERASRAAKLTLLDSSLSALDHLLKNALDEMQRAQSAVDQAVRSVTTQPGEAGEAAKWRLEAARQAERLMALRSLSLRIRRDTVQEKVEGAKIEIGRLDRMIGVARPKVRFLDSDMERLKKVSGETEASLLKEMDATDRRINAMLLARKKMQPELDRLPEMPADSPETALLRLKAATADVKLETLRDIREGLGALLQLEKAVRVMQQHRRDLWSGVDGAQRDRIVEDLVRYGERFRDWANLIKIEQETVLAEVANIEARKQALTKEDPRLALFEEQVAVNNEELEMVRRVAGAIDKQRKVMKRWLDHFAPETQGETGRWEAAWTKLRGVVPAIWSFKVMSFENKVEIGGEMIPVTVSVTMAMLVKAVLFFCIGYWIASKLVGRIRRGFVGRGFIGETQAKTLFTWTMLVVGFLLLLGTLNFLGIPLTMFAFLGGALAIGIGFGTQTLIKNFISGIILLFERKIRVGDIIDVDGIVGTVTEVNTRSSIIRSADEVETMVPNSLFLENRVTNWTLTNSRQRRSVRVGVAYGSDTRLVIDILKECAERHGLVCKDPAPFAVFDDFGESALVFSLYFWYDFRSESNPMVVASDLRLMIEKRFAESGIGVPFPQRDMHLTTTDPIRVQLAGADE